MRSGILLAMIGKAHLKGNSDDIESGFLATLPEI
jgi:hypothetical protein